MFGSHISLRVFPTWGEFHLYSRTELWTEDKKDNITSHTSTSLSFQFVDFILFYLQKRQVSLRSVLFHSGTSLHVWNQNLLKLQIRQKTNIVSPRQTHSEDKWILKFTYHCCNLLPTVQNWPNLFWEATLRPFSKVVILVSYFSWPSTDANTGLGIPGRGAEREIFGYPPPLLYFL